MSLGLIPTAPPPPSRAGSATPLSLVGRLGAALASRNVRYCQWKGHGKRERWENGRGDIDLLVDPTSWFDFTDMLGGLGFKLALPPPGREAAGILHFFGFDERAAGGQLVHLHVYQRLVIGSPWRTHYRLPMESALLDSAQQSTVFKTASPELELIVLVLRQALRHELRDTLRREPPRWLDGAISELDRLEDQVSRTAVIAALKKHLPEVSLDLFDRCRESLLPHFKPWKRVMARQQLVRALSAHASRAPICAPLERLWDRLRPVITGGRGQRLASGGSVVALLGGDGSGKSTCADALDTWLSSDLATLHVHLGKPRRGVVTYLVGALLKLARVVAMKRDRLVHLELLRFGCTARDRFRLYKRARRFAASGGIAICERYPTREGWALAGPSEVQGQVLDAKSPAAERLRRWERQYYERMTGPDLVFVLKVDPETAVARKTDEPAAYVRERAQLTWETDWTHSGARIIDATRPLPQVVAALKSELWRTL